MTNFENFPIQMAPIFQNGISMTFLIGWGDIYKFRIFSSFVKQSIFHLGKNIKEEKWKKYWTGEKDIFIQNSLVIFGFFFIILEEDLRFFPNQFITNC